MRSPLLPLALFLVACGGKPEAALVGTWSKDRSSIAFASDHRYTSLVGNLSLSGSWKLNDRQVVLTPQTMSGKPIDVVTEQLQKSMGRVPASFTKRAESMIRDIRATRTLTLSSDGKSLASTEGSWTGMTLTKAKP